MGGAHGPTSFPASASASGTPTQRRFICGGTRGTLASRYLWRSRYLLLGSWPNHFCCLRGGKRLFHRYWVNLPALPATMQSRHCVRWVFCEGLFGLASARYRLHCRDGLAAFPGVGREGKGGGREACCTRGAM